MKADQTHIESIRAAFQTMQSKEDFLNLLNAAKKFAYDGESHPFELRQITWYSNPAVNTKRYRQFTIKKKSGSDRTIHAPNDGLKAIQKVLAFVLQCVFEPNKAAYGFVKEKSIVDNATVHTGSNYVYNIDLKDFFPSIDQARVWKCFQLKPFYLVDTPAANEEEKFARLNTGVRRYKTEFGESIYYKINGKGLFLVNDKKGHFKKYKDRLTKHIPRPDFSGASNDMKLLLSLFSDYTDKINKILSKDAQRFIRTPENIFQLEGLVSSRTSLANIIASLCCTEMEVERVNEADEWTIVKRNVLPQGAPTSPVITNIVCQRLDYLLTAVAKRFGLKYSRYADDITFSSMHNVYQPASDFIKELHRIIAEQGFHIKDSKTRLQKKGYRQEVTGLLVNEKANVQQRYIKQLRMWIYYWERYGYERAYGYFLQQYLADKGHVIKGKPDMANVISGKLDYLKMVKGQENDLYVKLKGRFDALTSSSVTKAEVIAEPLGPSASLYSSEKGLLDGSKIEDDVSVEADPFDLFERFLEAKASGREDEETIELPSVNHEESSPKTVDEHLKGTAEKLRIAVNPIDLANGQVKLKRRIIIDKGKNLPLEDFIENIEKEEFEIDLSKHKPIDVTRFLLHFRSSEGLKYLTHDYDKPDSAFDYQKILRIAKSEFDELSKQFIVPHRLTARINQFAFGDPSKSWWFSKLRYELNWKSPRLLSWMEVNPQIHPINNEDFEKGFIAPFKRSIEIKSPDLESIFRIVLAENLGSKFGSFEIDFRDLDKANFYTNVDALQTGIAYIVKAIKQRFANSNKIRIEFSRKADAEGRKRIIKIIHIDSISNKPLEKNELFQGDLLEAEKALFGICDWSILSKSPDRSVNKLNVLYDITSAKPPREKIDDSIIDGFTHLLTFYA